MSFLVESSTGQRCSRTRSADESGLAPGYGTREIYRVAAARGTQDALAVVAAVTAARSFPRVFGPRETPVPCLSLRVLGVLQQILGGQPQPLARARHPFRRRRASPRHADSPGRREGTPGRAPSCLLASVSPLWNDGLFSFWCQGS